MIAGKTYSKILRKNQTDAEKIFWHRLRNRQFMGLKLRIIIELDGGPHNFENRKLKDDIRTKWLSKEGYLVLRFWNNDVIKNLEGVLEQIKMFVLR